MLFGSIERKDVSIFCMFKEKGFVGIAWQWVRSKRKGDIETAYVSSRIAHIGDHRRGSGHSLPFAMANILADNKKRAVAKESGDLLRVGVVCA